MNAAQSLLESLPRELRVQVYQAYLDSPAQEHQDEINASRYVTQRLQSAEYSIARDEYRQFHTQKFNADCDREHGNEASGFWSPFGLVTISTGEGKLYFAWSEAAVRWAEPALRQVNRSIAADARRYIWEERCRLVFADFRLMSLIVDKYRTWRAGLDISHGKALRKMYVDVSFAGVGLPVPTGPPGHRRYQPLNLRTEGYSLFKIETDDDRQYLRISSLYELAENQVHMVNAMLQSKIVAKKGSMLLADDFDGQDVFEAVDALLRVAAKHGGKKTGFFDHRPGDPDTLQLPMFWKVKLPSAIRVVTREKFNVKGRSGRGVTEVSRQSIAGAEIIQTCGRRAEHNVGRRANCPLDQKFACLHLRYMTLELCVKRWKDSILDVRVRS